MNGETLHKTLTLRSCLMSKDFSQEWSKYSSRSDSLIGETEKEKRVAEKKVTKILWLSRHLPDKGKERELERIFGEISVTVDDRPISSEGAKDIENRMKAGFSFE